MMVWQQWRFSLVFCFFLLGAAGPFTCCSREKGKNCPQLPFRAHLAGSYLFHSFFLIFFSFFYFSESLEQEELLRDGFFFFYYSPKKCFPLLVPPFIFLLSPLIFCFFRVYLLKQNVARKMFL